MEILCPPGPGWSSGTGGMAECGGCGGLLSRGGDDDRNEFDLTMLGVDGPPPTTPPAPFWKCIVYDFINEFIIRGLPSMTSMLEGGRGFMKKWTNADRGEGRLSQLGRP